MRVFKRQRIETLHQRCALLLAQLRETVQQHGEVGFPGLLFHNCQIGERCQRLTLLREQARHGIVGLGVIGLQFHPQLGRLQCRILMLQELRQVCGVGTDAGVAQQRRLLGVLFQCDIVRLASQCEFGDQQVVEAVGREWFFRHGNCGLRRFHGVLGDSVVVAGRLGGAADEQRGTESVGKKARHGCWVRGNPAMRQAV